MTNRLFDPHEPLTIERAAALKRFRHGQRLVVVRHHDRAFGHALANRLQRGEIIGRRHVYDWIIASDSHHPILSARKALWPNGQYATLGGGTVDILEAMVLGPVANRAGTRWSGIMLWWKPFHEPDVKTITDLVLAGDLRPAIDSVSPLEGIVEALTKVDERRASGKVLIRVVPSEA